MSIWARAVSASEVQVHWKPVPSGASRGEILAYEVGNNNNSYYGASVQIQEDVFISKQLSTVELET